MKKTVLLVSSMFLVSGCSNGETLKPQPTTNPWMKAKAEEKDRQLAARKPDIMEDVSDAGKQKGSMQLEVDVTAGQKIIAHLYNRSQKAVDTEYPYVNYSKWHLIGKNLTTGARAELSAIWKKTFEDSLNESDYQKDYRERSSRPMQVKSGKSEDYQFDLNQIFDLSVSGQYEFFVKTLIRNNSNLEWVVSQPIRIEVKNENPIALALPNKGNLEYLRGATNN